MSLERIRLIFRRLGGIVLTTSGLWIAVRPGPLGDRLIGAFGALCFAFGVWVVFSLDPLAKVAKGR